MQADDDFTPPLEFEGPEGIYRCGRHMGPRLHHNELGELTPVPPKLCIAAIRGEEPGAREALYTAMNVRKVVYFYRNREDIPIDTVQLSRQPKEAPTSHDINLITRSPSSLQVLIGFSGGEIVIHDALAKRSCVFNRACELVDKPVSVVRWVPGSESVFLAAFSDGSLFVFDTARTEIQPLKHLKEEVGFRVIKQKAEASNPVASWHLSDHHGAIYDMRFSPDARHLALVGRDGRLRLLNYVDEKEVCTMSAYFGALTCVAWSSDGRYILTGGQDDLVTIWSFEDQEIVARCQGHNSWVTSVSFDSYRTDGNIYRIGSVGQDARLLLWDFNPLALAPPRVVVHAPQASVASPKQSRWRRKKSKHAADPKQGKKMPQMAVLPAKGKGEVPMLEPVAHARLHADPITDVAFLDQSIVTVCQAGELCLWTRPDNFQGATV